MDATAGMTSQGGSSVYVADAPAYDPGLAGGSYATTTDFQRHSTWNLSGLQRPNVLVGMLAIAAGAWLLHNWLGRGRRRR